MKLCDPYISYLALLLCFVCHIGTGMEGSVRAISSSLKALQEVVSKSDLSKSAEVKVTF